MDVPIKSRVKSDLTGKAQFMFPDGATVSVAPDTDISLSEYVETPEEENIVLNLARGSARIITGEISRRNSSAFIVNTPQTSIGVRGTIVSIAVRGDETKIYLTETSGKGVSVLDRATGKTLNLRAPGNIITVSPQGVEQRKPAKGEVAAMNSGLRTPAAQTVLKQSGLVSANSGGINGQASVARTDRQEAEHRNILPASAQYVAAVTSPVNPQTPQVPSGGGEQTPVTPPEITEPSKGPASVPLLPSNPPASAMLKKYVEMPGLNPDTLPDGHTWKLLGQYLIPATGNLREPGSKDFDMYILVDILPPNLYTNNILTYTKDQGLTAFLSIFHNPALFYDKDNNANNKILIQGYRTEHTIYQKYGSFKRISDSLFKYESKDGKINYFIKIISRNEVIIIAENYSFSDYSFSEYNQYVNGPESLELKFNTPDIIKTAGIDPSLLNGTFKISDTIWSNKDAMPGDLNLLKDISQISFDGTIKCNANNPNIQIDIKGERIYGNIADYKNYKPSMQSSLTDVDRQKFSFSGNSSLYSDLFFYVSEFRGAVSKFENGDPGPIENIIGTFTSKDGGQFQYDVREGNLYGINGKNAVFDIKGNFTRIENPDSKQAK